MTHFFGMFGIPVSRVYTNVSTFGFPLLCLMSCYPGQTLMDTLLARHELRAMFKSTGLGETKVRRFRLLLHLEIDRALHQQQSDAIWMVHNTPALPKQVSHNSIQLHIRKEIHTDAWTDDVERSPPSSDLSRRFLDPSTPTQKRVSEFPQHEKALSI